MQPSLAATRSIGLKEGDRPIPGYRLVRPRGRGGFGEVWEAEASGGFRVALKFVRLSSRALASELRSLEFVRGVHHPNLLANFGAWQVDGILIVGMELADRSLWDRYIEAANQALRGIPRRELLGYFSEVASGVDHLNGHRHTLDGRTGIGVQHRDLKPSNILLYGGGAKVADLGMARAMEGEVAGPYRDLDLFVRGPRILPGRDHPPIGPVQPGRDLLPAPGRSAPLRGACGLGDGRPPLRPARPRIAARARAVGRRAGPRQGARRPMARLPGLRRRPPDDPGGSGPRLPGRPRRRADRPPGLPLLDRRHRPDRDRPGP